MRLFLELVCLEVCSTLTTRTSAKGITWNLRQQRALERYMYVGGIQLVVILKFVFLKVDRKRSMHTSTSRLLCLNL